MLKDNVRTQQRESPEVERGEQAKRTPTVWPSFLSSMVAVVVVVGSSVNEMESTSHTQTACSLLFTVDLNKSRWSQRQKGISGYMLLSYHHGIVDVVLSLKGAAPKQYMIRQVYDSSSSTMGNRSDKQWKKNPHR